MKKQILLAIVFIVAIFGFAYSTYALTCVSSLVEYQSQCVDPIPTCRTPIANSVSCIDKIENGQYIEHYSFSCIPDFIKYNNQCVDPIPACRKPIANSTSCIDKIENGQYIDHYYFSCLPDYQKTADQCVGSTTTTCQSPYVLYLGQCVDPIPACRKPIANSTSCIDKIENGQYIDHYKFSCLPNYKQTADQCVGSSTTPVQCYARTVEGDGKYLIELKGGNDRTEACRFLKWHYDIVSGQAKKIAADQYTVTFDDSLKGTIKLVVEEPTPYESTFTIGSRYAGTTSTSSPSTISPNPTTVQNPNIPTAGYEDEVLTAFDSSPFSDTDVNTASGKAAAELYRRGVIGGYADGEFKGSRPVNRAEAAKFLLLARYGNVDEASNNGKFWDVLDGQWYTKFVVKANQLGIIMGYGDGSFKPANTVTTAEFVKMLTKTFDLPENLPYDFVDVQPTDWFAPYAGIAQKYDLFPNHKTKLLPQTLLARDEVAVAIYQYLKNR